jgi:hypothetical protein
MNCVESVWTGIQNSILFGNLGILLPNYVSTKVLGLMSEGHIIDVMIIFPTGKGLSYP